MTFPASFLRFAALLLSVAPAALLPGAQPPAAPAATPAAKTGDEMVNQLMLPDADIDTMLTALEQLTGRIVIRPQQLTTATYNLKIKAPVTKADAIVAIETSLALNGIGLSPLGEKYLKVIKIGRAHV